MGGKKNPVKMIKNSISASDNRSLAQFADMVVPVIDAKIMYKNVFVSISFL
jgi:hypothetical protein